MKNYLINFILLFLLINNNKVFSKDIKNIKNYTIENNGELEVNVSNNSINRLTIFNDRIKSIRANSEELHIDTDEKLGEIYLKPLVQKDIDIFITTEKNMVYKFLLKVKNLPSQQILINQDNFTLNKYSNADFLRREQLKLIDENLYFDFDNDYKISAINLIRLMYFKQQNQNFNIIHRDQKEILNFKDFKVEWLYSYVKNDKSEISGEITKITNKTNKKIFLKEEFFLRRGIRAVSLEKIELEPKETCLLFLVGGN